MLDSITIENFEGYFYCHSYFGSYHLTCDRFSYKFEHGITILYGDIDCGGWGVSCGISQKQKDIVLSSEEIIAEMNDTPCDLEKIYTHAWYMDQSFGRKTVEKLVNQGLKKTNSNISAENIREIFQISSDRFQLPIQQVGNERFRCVAAIGYAFSKSIYCFPWISKKMVEYYGKNLIDVLEILEKLKQIVILPTNYQFKKYEKTTYDFEKEWEKYIQTELRKL